MDPMNGYHNSYKPVLETLDSNNAIIIFENSHSDSPDDTLISARDKWEARWRRLPFYLNHETRDDITDDEIMAGYCAKAIILDVWKALSESWLSFIEKADSHVEILENKIYEYPADESRADEVWTNASSWLKTERQLYRHLDVISEFQAFLKE